MQVSMDQGTLKRKRTDMTIDEKKEIIKFQKDNPSWSQQAIADEFNKIHKGKNVKRNTVSVVLKSSSTIMAINTSTNRGKRNKDAVYTEVESALLAWFKQVRSKGGMLTDEMLLKKATILREAIVQKLTSTNQLDKAEKYKDFKVSNGWLHKFKLRHDIARVYMHGESGDADGMGVAHSMQALPLILAQYKPEDVYTMDETGLFYRAQPNKTLAHGMVKGRKIQKDRITLALAANCTGTHKLRLVMVYKSKKPQCFGSWQPTSYISWYSNATTWMTADVFEDWMTRLNNQCRNNGRNILMIMDNATTHMLPNVVQSDLQGLKALVLSNLSIVFFPPNVTHAVQPMDQGIIASFKMRYRAKLLEWVLSQFDSNTEQDLRKIVPDVRQAIMWSYEVWQEMEPQIFRNSWRASRILPMDWSVDFATDDEWEKRRMQKESDDLSNLMSQLQLGQDEIALPEYVEMIGEDVVEAEYTTEGLVDLALGIDCQTSEELEEEDEANDIDEQSPPTVKLQDARHYARMISNFVLDNPQDFGELEVMNIQKLLGKLNKMGIANLRQAS